jgi:hypothetical protein
MACALDARGLMLLAATQSAGNSLWYATQTDSSTDTWCPLSPLATVPEASPHDLAALSVPALALDANGRAEMFVVIRETGKLYQLSATTPGQPPSVGRTWPYP